MNVFFNTLKSILPIAVRSSVKARLRHWLWPGNTQHPQMPKLQQKHIANLQAVVDRTALLKLLPKDGIIAEIGVAEGNYSEQIQKISRPQKLHLIDTWDSIRYHQKMLDGVNQRFKHLVQTENISVHQGLSTEVVHEFKDSYFDWIYIDTDHSYLTTREELRLYAPKLKKNGIIAGHDFTKGNFEKGIRYGVIEAVYEFCVLSDWEFIFITMEMNENPSFAIRKIKPEK